jgi:hypothetical protein
VPRNVLDESEVPELVESFPQWKQKTIERSFDDKNGPNDDEPAA